MTYKQIRSNIQLPERIKSRENELMMVRIGKKRKGLLVNYNLNTGRNLTEWTTKMIDEDAKRNPILYAAPVHLSVILKQHVTIEAKVEAVLRYYKRFLSLRAITSALNTNDMKRDRSILRVMVSSKLQNPMFFEKKCQGKHNVYGLTSWIEDKVF